MPRHLPGVAAAPRPCPKLEVPKMIACKKNSPYRGQKFSLEAVTLILIDSKNVINVNKCNLDATACKLTATLSNS